MLVNFFFENHKKHATIRMQKRRNISKFNKYANANYVSTTYIDIYTIKFPLTFTPEA